MAVLFECDRCSGRMAGRPEYTIYQVTASTKKEEKHLCKKCQEDFIEFMGVKEDHRWTTG